MPWCAVAAAHGPPGGRRQGLHRAAGAGLLASPRDWGGHLLPHDRAAYRERNAVDRLIHRLKRNRGIATRYEKLQEIYHALLTIGCILLWL